jgi:phosphoenolpyruvate-protein kinase (PTS system EI component)
MARVANETLYIEGKGGVFEPAPKKAELRKQKREAEKRRQTREEWQAIAASIGAVLFFAALGAWQGSLMVMR